MQLASEEIGGRAEIMRNGRIAFDPSFRPFVDGGLQLVVGGNQPLEGIADLRVFCIRDFLFAVLRAPPAIEFCADRHLHVGLSGAEPDFADKDILQFHELLAVGDFDVAVDAAGFHWRKLGAPFAVFADFCGDCSSVEFDGDFVASVSGSEEGDRLMLLEHHVRGEHGIHFQVCERPGGKENRRSERR